MTNEDRSMYVSLRDYVDERFAATEKTTQLMRDVMDHRLETMNEFREQLSNQAHTFVTHTENNRTIEDIKVLREYKAGLESKASQSSVNVAFAVAVLSLLVSLVGLILKLRG